METKIIRQFYNSGMVAKDGLHFWYRFLLLKGWIAVTLLHGIFFILLTSCPSCCLDTTIFTLLPRQLSLPALLEGGSFLSGMKQQTSPDFNPTSLVRAFTRPENLTTPESVEINFPTDLETSCSSTTPSSDLRGMFFFFDEKMSVPMQFPMMHTYGRT